MIRVWVIQKGNAINLPSHGNNVLGALGLTRSQRLRFWGPWFTDTFRTGIKDLRQGATLRMPVAPLIQFPTNIVLQFLLSCVDAFAICFFGFKFLRVRVTCGTIHASWWLCLWLYLIIKPHFEASWCAKVRLLLKWSTRGVARGRSSHLLGLQPWAWLHDGTHL